MHVISLFICDSVRGMMNYLDTVDITEAHESQCVEFKEASFELPKDAWETYSAFANTEGGEIFLGISGDGKDQSFSITGVMDSQSIITAFWNKVRNPQEVSRDIMLKDGVYTIEKEGKEIVVISVPRAERGDKPVSVYDKKNKWVSWVRRGTGDYKASEQDITLMQYDGIPHADRKPLEGFTIDAFSPSTIKHYRNLFASRKPQNPWISKSDEDFLYFIGALAKGYDGNLYATQAGLLAFGLEYEITNYFPHYLLDYREETSGVTRWDDRIVSQSGDWSGNLLDFYFMVTDKLLRYFKTPFTIDEAGVQHLETSVLAEALNEVIANALIHAYYGTTASIRVLIKPLEIEVSNPGSFLVDRQVAIAGGFSEARNPTLMRLFSLIGVSDRAGSGIQKIWSTWEDCFNVEPSYVETHAPASVVLHLPILMSDKNTIPVSRADSANTAGVENEKVQIIDTPASLSKEKRDILALFADRDQIISSQDVVKKLNISERMAQKHLKQLYEKGFLEREKKSLQYEYSLK